MRPLRCNSGKAEQHGAALMLMLVIIVVGAATFLVSSLSTSALKIRRQEITATALGQARESLIGYAVKDSNRPGELPCPDVNGDGMLTMGVDYNFGTPSCISYIGYLPWKTLGLPELRDGDNAKLWYALSPNFYAGNSTPINSDTQGQLSITGNLSSGNVVAIIFAPGSPLCGKTHGSNNVADYLEAGDGSTSSYTLKSLSEDCSNSPYNDKLLAITASNLFQPVEKRVAGEIRQMLNAYYATWGAYPFAAPFADPSTSSFTGMAGQTYGLLPVGNAITPYWNTASLPTATLNGAICDATTTPKCTLTWRPTGCINNCTYWRCVIGTGITGTPTIRITGTLNGVGLGTWRYDPSGTVATTPEVAVRISSTGTTDHVATTVLSNVSFTGSSIDASGNATVVFSGTVLPGAGNAPTRIQLYPGIIPSHQPSWFGIGANNWNQVMYYAISPGYAPAGGNACNPLPGTPACLTLGGSSSGSNKRAILVMTGNALAGQIHPQNTIANYLEGENATPLPPTPPDYIYENRPRTSAFNDQVIAVSP